METPTTNYNKKKKLLSCMLDNDLLTEENIDDVLSKLHLTKDKKQKKVKINLRIIKQIQ